MMVYFREKSEFVDEKLPFCCCIFKNRTSFFQGVLPQAACRTEVSVAL
jgi:hypothetical protein